MRCSVSTTSWIGPAVSISSVHTPAWSARRGPRDEHAAAPSPANRAPRSRPAGDRCRSSRARGARAGSGARRRDHAAARRRRVRRADRRGPGRESGVVRIGRPRRGHRPARRRCARREEEMSLLRGALIEYGTSLIGPIPNIVIFQFNPESLSRSLQIPPRPTGATQRETTQAGEKTFEKITFKAHFSAANLLADDKFLART